MVYIDKIFYKKAWITKKILKINFSYGKQKNKFHGRVYILLKIKFKSFN